ncbi:hypothetical protein ACU686_21700 [Yinghuangia aomiensis]
MPVAQAAGRTGAGVAGGLRSATSTARRCTAEAGRLVEGRSVRRDAPGARIPCTRNNKGDVARRAGITGRALSSSAVPMTRSRSAASGWSPGRVGDRSARSASRVAAGRRWWSPSDDRRLPPT